VLALAQSHRLARDYGIGVAVWVAPLLLIVAWPVVPVAVAAIILIGVGNSLVDVNELTIIQRLVADEVMARASGAIDSLLIAAMGVGALAMPILIRLVGIRAALGVLGVLVLVIVTPAFRRLRRLDHTALAPPDTLLLRGCATLAPLPEAVLERLARSVDVVTRPRRRGCVPRGRRRPTAST
jgi:hypothetical protein